MTLDVPSDAPIEVIEAYIFRNGMVMAFDVWGKQVADYQGRRDEVLPRIRQDFPEAKIVGEDDPIVWMSDRMRNRGRGADACRAQRAPAVEQAAAGGEECV
jgi:hypothetical protein